MSRYVGIDPGKGGAVAVLDGYGEIVWVEDMPVIGNQVNGTVLADMLDDLTVDSAGVGGSIDVIVVVERVAAYPAQGISSAFDFGKSFGIVLGVVAASSVRMIDVPPNRWKRAMHLTADKELCRRRAIERWPRQVERFKRKKDEGRAEACLLAAWLLEHEDAELTAARQRAAVR